MKTPFICLLLTGCASVKPEYDGVQRCVMVPIGNNADGALVALMKCRPEGTPI